MRPKHRLSRPFWLGMLKIVGPAVGVLLLVTSYGLIQYQQSDDHEIPHRRADRDPTSSVRGPGDLSSEPRHWWA